MARKYLVPIDLSKQELQNAVIQNLATAPGSPVAGQVYFDTVDDTLYFYDGTVWVDAQTDPYAYATPGETTEVTIAGTESDGTSTRLARADHQHAGPGFGTPTAQTSYGSSSSTGSATTVAHSDHTHGTPSLTAVSPQALTIAGTAAVGTGTAPAREDHVHAGPGFGNVTGQTSYGASSANGSATTVARSDHAHGTPAHTDTEHSTIHLNALAAPTGNVSMNSYKITGLQDPVDAGDAANKGYVDGAIAGLDWKEAAHLLSNANVPLTGSLGSGLVIDSHDPLTSADNGYRILLINQTTASEAGIYTFFADATTYTLTRATDANTYLELKSASLFISEGTLYGKTSWVQANHYLTDFSGQEWVQFAGQGTYLAANGVVLDVNTFKFAPKTDGGLNTGSSGAFVKLPTNSGLGTTSNGLAVGAGTGISVSGGTVAIDTSVVARKYAVSLTGSATSYTVTHNLGTRDVTVQVREVASPYAKVEPDIEMATTNTITVKFAVAPSSDQYSVVVIG